MKNVTQKQDIQPTPPKRSPEKERSHRMAIAFGLFILVFYIGFFDTGVIDIAIVFGVSYGIARLLSVKLW